MGRYRVRNWSQFQHYTKRRPPWIKVHRALLEDLEWFELSGEDAKTLIGLWILAAETNDGSLPNVENLAFRLRKPESKVELQLQRLSHWIEPCLQEDSTMLASCTQSACLETETETEREPETYTEESRVEETCSELEKSLAPSRTPILTWPLVGKNSTGGYEVHQAHVDEWQTLFPGIDVMVELRKCLAWSLGNPTKQKTRQGIKRHITGWLSSAQDSAARNSGGMTSEEKRQEAIRGALALTSGKTYEH